REAVRAIADLRRPPGSVLLIRVNPVGSPWFAEDVHAAAECAADGVVLPKLESRDDLGRLHERLHAQGLEGAVVIAGLETAAGVADCRELSAGGLSGVYFGAEDYIADLGGYRTQHGQEVLFARSQVVLAARLCGIAAIDQVVTSVRSDEAFLTDAQAGRAMGYVGKICLHPRQIELAHRVFSPSEAEIEHAEAVIAAARHGVGVVDGQMVDEVHLKIAAATLGRAR
ncbi:MAG: HpcH/HpaI aldolase/citrate lyase family protein, partial [Sciscionella sp.]